MTMQSIQEQLRQQRDYLLSGATLDRQFRENALDSLRSVILAMEERIAEALTMDLGKSPGESWLTETGLVLEELGLARKKLRAWMRPRTIPTPLPLLPGRSRIYPEPYGLCLVVAPWNYPFHLTVLPMLSAVASGNCVTLKPSSKAPHTSAVVRDIVQRAFDSRHVAVIPGDARTGEALLQERFDFILYTGSARVGRTVMRAAAEHLTPVCLELGGKSPALVMQDADLALAARRIAWGKTVNAGQTCVAPDYVLAHVAVKDTLADALEAEFARFPGPDALNNPEYGRIISEEALLRLAQLGGPRTRFDRTSRRMAPLVMREVSVDHPVMREEIFGPLLPVLGFTEPRQAVDQVRQMAAAGGKPLACYLFTRDAKLAQRLIRTLSFGGGCVNDTLIHMANPGLPFGGVGHSGMGRYHGQAGFELFSNKKSMLHKSAWPELALRYPPYSPQKLAWLRRLLR